MASFEAPYRDHPVDADTFGAAAVARVARVSRRFLITTRAFRASVIDVKTRREEYARALHVIEHRDVVLRAIPARGKGRSALSELPDPRAVDPWAVDDDQLAKEKVLCTCPQCAGTKDVLCGTCGGVARVRCLECAGSGRVAGARGPKNCPSCRGAGDRRCPYCRRGYITCPTCAGAGRAYVWLEVVATRHVPVVVAPACVAAAAHNNVRDARDFDASRTIWPAELRGDTGNVLPSNDLPLELRATVDPRADRVVSVRVQTFEGKVAVVRFATAFGEGSVIVAGSAYRIDPTSDWRPLYVRRAVILAAAVLAMLGSAFVYAGYANRAPFFADYGHGGIVWLASVVAGFAATALLGALLLRSAA